MPMFRKLSAHALAAAALALGGSACAATESDNRLWLNLNAQGALPASKFHWYFELQPRWRDDFGEFDQLLIRPALFYKFSDRASLWLGYANVRTERATSGSIEEHRLWQQLSYSFKLRDYALQSRTRLEQRDVETGDDLGHRLRQLVRVSRPLASNPKVSLIASDELFFNLNRTDWGARSGFDQNRLFLGAGYSFNAKLRIEAGYVNQYVNTSTVNRQNHVLSTTFALSF